jgi:hypothetical protein
MRLTLFTCAVSYAVDQHSNAVSLFNIVERIAVPAFPSGLPEVCLVAMLSRGGDGPRVPLRLMASLGQYTLLNEPFEVAFSEDGLARGFGRLGGLPLPEAGTVVFALWRGNQKLGECRIAVCEAAAAVEEYATLRAAPGTDPTDPTSGYLN